MSSSKSRSMKPGKGYILFISIFLLGGWLFYCHYSPAREHLSDQVYITKTGKKYHQVDCYYLRHSKIEMSRVKAEELGLTPCKVCFYKPAAYQEGDTVIFEEALVFQIQLENTSVY
ncbi:MAG: hypothetical protein CMI36_13280 [Owenweeksia sp.]|nr:hypothetical protein [Owenweeksia sp.]MBF99960.1 hypothetical protein [Owenweeksia sp.]HBF19962.1 hypothetical protein [Cryomorphaceae bacterium]